MEMVCQRKRLGIFRVGGKMNAARRMRQEILYGFFFFMEGNFITGGRKKLPSHSEVFLR